MRPVLSELALCSTCRQFYPAQTELCPRDRTPLELRRDILAGKFILGRELGSGGMGVVYEAEQPAMERKVAVKLLHAERTRDPKMVERFEREARAAGKINHANVVTIYESGRTEDGGQIYIAMEHLEGESLASLLRREQRLSPPRALSIFVPVVKAMAAAHHAGVVHRDLKPDNIFIASAHGSEGVEEQVKVLDFGIAKLQTALHAATADGTLLGTLQYMAPEQLDGRPADPRSDVYALGLLLLEMLSGRTPWGPKEGGLPAAAFLLRLTQAPLSLSVLCPTLAIPLPWQQLLDEILAIDMGGRPAHAGVVLQRLRQLLALAPPPWPEVPAPEEITDARADHDATRVTIALPLPEPPRGADPTPSRETNGPSSRRRWVAGGIAGGLASFAIVLSLWRHWAPAASASAPVDMAPAAISLDLAVSARPSEGRQPPPVETLQDRTEQPVQVRFRPKVPKTITIECTGRHPLDCSAPGGCKVMLPSLWKCTASAGRVYLARSYKHSEFSRKSPEIDVELKPTPLAF